MRLECILTDNHKRILLNIFHRANKVNDGWIDIEDYFGVTGDEGDKFKVSGYVTIGEYDTVANLADLVHLDLVEQSKGKIHLTHKGYSLFYD